MENTERFINNEKFFDERFYGIGDELVLSLKEHPKYNIHIWEGFIFDILRDAKAAGDYWAGFTRDYNEMVRTFCGDPVEMEDISEYINDLLLYKDDEFEDDEDREAYTLILDFLRFAKENNQTVMADIL